MSFLPSLPGRWWRPRQKAFTLIELLVVIGLIAVVMSRLLPVIQKARDAANRTANTAHFRKISLFAVKGEPLPGGIRALAELGVIYDSTSWVCTRDFRHNTPDLDRALCADNLKQLNPRSSVSRSIDAKLDRAEKQKHICLTAGESFETILHTTLVSCDPHHFRRGDWTSFCADTPVAATLVPLNTRWIGARGLAPIPIENGREKNEGWAFKSGDDGGSHLAFMSASPSFLSESTGISSSQRRFD